MCELSVDGRSLIAADAGVLRARRGLALYLSLVIVGSAVLQTLLLRGEGRMTGGLVFLLMWTPGLVSLLLRLVRREGVGDISFRLGSRALTAMGLALVFPVAVGVLAYVPAWVSGLATWSAPDLRLFGTRPSEGPRFLVLLLINLTAGTFLGSLSAAGEELGWRGYMLTRLIEGRIPQPVLMSGLIWGAWHLPLILSGKYAAGPVPWLSAIVFMVNVTTFAFFLAQLRLSTGSIWPAIVGHASWNAVIQGVFDASTALKTIWIGEAGLLVTLVDIALVALVVRGRWVDHFPTAVRRKQSTV